MTTITLDDDLINEISSLERCQNIQEVVSKILFDYVRQHKQVRQLFDELRLSEEVADDDLPLLFERDKDSGRSLEL